MSKEKQGYRVENRWGDKPWWVIYYYSDGRTKVISKHSSKTAAQRAKNDRSPRRA